MLLSALVQRIQSHWSRWVMTMSSWHTKLRNLQVDCAKGGRECGFREKLKAIQLKRLEHSCWQKTFKKLNPCKSVEINYHKIAGRVTIVSIDVSGYRYNQRIKKQILRQTTSHPREAIIACYSIGKWLVLCLLVVCREDNFSHSRY